jgi:hypothetical protein
MEGDADGLITQLVDMGFNEAKARRAVVVSPLLLTRFHHGRRKDADSGLQKAVDDPDKTCCLGAAQ